MVRRIFDDVVRGRGFARVARGLNAERIPGPRGPGWAMTGVRAIVFRDLYRGRIFYGRTRWVDRGGTKVKVDVPHRECLTVDAPALRIVSEDAWTAAHTRLERTRQTYVVGGRLSGRPEAGIESRYLLGGFVVCGPCQGSMHAIKRTSRRGAPRVYYVCNGWRVNGTCGNAWSLPLPDLDAAVLTALEEDVPTPDLVDDVVARAAELWGEQHAGLGARRRNLEREVHQVERQLGRLAEAVAAAGEPFPSLLARLRAGERRRAELQAQLEHVDGLGRAARLAYALSPIDLIPDFIPVLGYLDDLVVIPLGVLLMRRWIPVNVWADCRARAELMTARPVSRVGAAIVVGVWLLLAGLTVWLIRRYWAG